MSKKLEEKQRRRLEAEQKKAAQRRAQQRGNLITIGIAVAVAAIVIVAVVVQRRTDEATSVGVAAAQAGCTEIEEFDAEDDRDHVDPGVQVDYETTPPAYGSHWPPDQVADPGFYTSPVEEERLVHNLEHSQIVIWYRPDAPSTMIAQLEEITAQERLATITVPYDQLEPPHNVAITAWGAIQRCEQVSQAVIDDFRRRFQGRGPEKIAPPFTG